MNWLDYVFILCIAGNAFDGYNRGMVPVLLRFTGAIAALAGATLWAGRVAEFCDRVWGVRAHLTSFLSDHISVPVVSPDSLADSALADSTFSASIREFVSASAHDLAAGYLIPRVTEIIMVIGGFLIAFIILRTAIKCLEAILDGLLVQFVGQGGSSLLGVGASLAQSGLIICLSVAVLYAAATLPPLHFVASWVEMSRLSAVALDLIDRVWPLISSTLAPL